MAADARDVASGRGGAVIHLVRMAYRPDPELGDLPVPEPGFGWVRFDADGVEEDRHGPWTSADGAYHDLCTNAANWAHEVVDLVEDGDVV